MPLPWCTSKSTIATRLRLRRCSAYKAAIATLLKKQKPMALLRVAWWPGGRTAQKAFSSSPASTASVAATAAPAARSAAVKVWALMEVSVSSWVYSGPPAACSSTSLSVRPRSAATCMRSWASSTSLSAASGASHPFQRPSTPR